MLTTLNIQHLESLNDVVESIAGVKVRERIPDEVLDRADEIILVDLSTDELRHRLRAGQGLRRRRRRAGAGELLPAGEPERPCASSP